MRFARKIDLDSIRFEVQCDLLLKSQVRRLNVKGRHTWIPLNCHRTFPSEICADYGRRWPNHRVPPLMIRMIVRVHNKLHGQVRDSPDCSEQFGGFSCIEPRVNHQDARVADKKSGICAGIVVGDVGVKTLTNLRDRRFSRNQRRADQRKKYAKKSEVSQIRPHQKLSFNANWISLGPPDPRPTLFWAASGVVKSAPKLGAAEMLLGKAKLGWLVMLKNSARNCALHFSANFMFL